jgi:N-acetyl-alpha-D-glucosaminyl L-malate synthase BshA
VSWSINHSDAVTAVSESLRNDTLQHFHIRRDIDVVPNFIDFTRFNKQPKEHFKKAISPNGERVLVHTSNFRKVKRVEDVIAVFNLVNKQIPSKLLMIGDGPERSHIEKISRELDCHERITFLGKQEAVEEILSVCDLFILPSETESFGLAALEAMACEVPVISSNAGGIPEVNIHGETGYLSNVGDVEDMAANALKILVDDEVLKNFKKRALQRSKDFDLDRVMDDYVRIYERCLKAK